MPKDTCDHPTDGGEPCRLPACRPDGRCWHHTGTNRADTGRPSKLNLERQEEIAQAIENGKSVDSSARMAGVHPSTVYRWLDKGQDQDEGPYREFRERYVRARGHGLDFFESNLIEIALAEGDVATLMTLMRQQYPDAYGEAKRGEQAGDQTVIQLPESVVEKWQRPADRRELTR